MAFSSFKLSALSLPWMACICALVCLLAFANSLPNGFVGDDNFLILNNSFYHSWQNIGRLFNNSYLSNSDAILNLKDADLGSGSVAYRPVLSLTYFMDYFLWQKNPFGYHLTNFLLHLFNTLGVLFLVYEILGSKKTAFISAILFCAHPLKSEPVCAIGYRADSLACLWFLAAFLCYVYRHREKGNGLRFILAHLFFLLSVFTKESAAVFPFLIMAYDGILQSASFRKINVLKNYGGFIGILLFYFFIYFKVFPNHTLAQADASVTNVFEQVGMIVTVFSGYVTAILFPFLVKVLPPLYKPEVFPLMSAGFLRMTLGILVFVLLCVGMVRSHKKLLFFVLWFCLAFLPVSNIVPIVNPFAYRFMYLPSIGYSVLLAVLFEYLVSINNQIPMKSRKSWGKWAAVIFVGICMMTTATLNIAWRNDQVMAYSMIESFPDNPKGYYFAGINDFKSGKSARGCHYFQKAADLGLSDPRVHHMLGVCHIDDLELSKNYFEHTIQEYPSYAMAYVGLGRYYILKGDIESSVPLLKKSLELAPKYSAYGYLIQIYLQQGDRQKARNLLDEAMTVNIRPDHLQCLNNFFDPSKFTTFPIDIGI